LNHFFSVEYTEKCLVVLYTNTGFIDKYEHNIKQNIQIKKGK